MSLREEQCNKVCRILDDVLANRPTERDSLIVAVRKAFAEPKRGKWIKYEQEFMLEGSLGTVQKTVRECSVCTAKIAGMVGIMNFCPNCGSYNGGENEI